MAAIETLRARGLGDPRAAAIGEGLRGWGIATPIALFETLAGAPGLPVIATGGVRSGLDAARALALGATLAGVGLPFLKAASEGEEALRAFVEGFVAELRVAMQLTGAASVAALRRVPVVITGATHAWLEVRGFGDQVRALARRGMAAASGGP
jgi:isopentenyl-diphosphate delta-isomerase